MRTPFARPEVLCGQKTILIPDFPNTPHTPIRPPASHTTMRSQLPKPPSLYSPSQQVQKHAEHAPAQNLRIVPFEVSRKPTAQAGASPASFREKMVVRCSLTTGLLWWQVAAMSALDNVVINTSALPFLSQMWSRLTLGESICLTLPTKRAHIHFGDPPPPARGDASTSRLSF